MHEGHKQAVTLGSKVKNAITNLYEVGGGASRIVPMEGLRGLAVLLVFFVHLQAMFGDYARGVPAAYGASEFLGYVGNSGVDLFFLLSGYFIYGALIRRPVPYGQFMQRRIERLYPTFLGVFSIYLALSAAFASENKIHGTFVHAGLFVLANLFLLPGFFHITPIITVAWSLSFELFFYLLAPVVISLLGMRKWRVRYRIAFLLVFWVGFAGAMYSIHSNHIRMLGFVSGAILYEVAKHAPLRKWLTAGGEWLAIFFVPVAFALYFFIQRTASHPAYEWIFPIVALTAAFFFLTLFACMYQGKLCRFFSLTPIRYLGNMSYSYYLVHGVTLKAVAMVFLVVLGARLSLPIFISAMFVGFAATWVSSTLLFWLVEKRFSLQPKMASLSVAPALHLQPTSADGVQLPMAAKAAAAAESAQELASSTLRR